MMITTQDIHKNFVEINEKNLKLKKLLKQEKTITKTIDDIEKYTLPIIYKLLWKYKKGNTKETILEYEEKANSYSTKRRIEISGIGIGNINAGWSSNNSPYISFFNNAGGWNNNYGFYDNFIKNKKAVATLREKLRPEGQKILDKIELIFNKYDLKNENNYFLSKKVCSGTEYEYLYDIGDIHLCIEEGYGDIHIYFGEGKKSSYKKFEFAEISAVDKQSYDKFTEQVLIYENYDNIVDLYNQYLGDKEKLIKYWTDFYNEFNKELNKYVVAFTL